VEALRENSHEVRIISPRSWLERRGSMPRIPLPGLVEMNVNYAPYFYTPGILRRFYDRFMWVSVGSRLRQEIAQFKPDCILSYWSHPDGSVAVRAGHEIGLPVGVIVGGSDVLLLPGQDPARGRKIARTLRTADAVITVNKHLRERVMDLGVSADRAHVVYQGVDQKLFSPGDQTVARRRVGIEENGKVLLFVGNLVPVKGIDVLLRAMARICRRGCAATLYLVGDGPLRRSLEDLAGKLEIMNWVRFVGPVLQKDLPDWYRSADLTVISSHSEGLPNVLRESLACGTPFVATNVGGISEIAETGMSRLVEAGNPELLADAIMEELARPRAKRAVCKSGWVESANRIVEIIDDSVARASAKHGSKPLEEAVCS
jgi:glycosyltransferase involved in cell wall biosynthesis